MTYIIFFTYNLHYIDIFYIEYKYKDDKDLQEQVYFLKRQTTTGNQRICTGNLQSRDPEEPNIHTEGEFNYLEVRNKH